MSVQGVRKFAIWLVVVAVPILFLFDRCDKQFGPLDFPENMVSRADASNVGKDFSLREIFVGDRAMPTEVCIVVSGATVSDYLSRGTRDRLTERGVFDYKSSDESAFIVVLKYPAKDHVFRVPHTKLALRLDNSLCTQDLDTLFTFESCASCGGGLAVAMSNKTVPHK